MNGNSENLAVKSSCVSVSVAPTLVVTFLPASMLITLFSEFANVSDIFANCSESEDEISSESPKSPPPDKRALISSGLNKSSGMCYFFSPFSSVCI